MLKAYCDNCGKEIQVNSNNEVYLKIANAPLCCSTNFTGIFCKKCENKIRKIIRVLARRYSMKEK